MAKQIDDFFSMKNTVRSLSESDKGKTMDYLAPIKAFARTTYKSIYIIDYQVKGFEYVSANPLFLCGHTPEEVQRMGYGFYFKYVPETDLDLLLRINTLGFDLYEKQPMEERLLYSITYDFRLRNQEGKDLMINQKLTPLFLTETGQVWKALCVISLSNEQHAGNVKVHKQGTDEVMLYDFDAECWRVQEKIKLSEREQEILQYSSRGFSIKEIAEALFVSPDTVKFHRRKMFEKLEVANISEALSYATHNKLI
jgi:DNA-binding CsgD family transcriptional regulator